MFDLTIAEMTNTLRSLDRDKSWNCQISTEWGVSKLSGPARDFLNTRGGLNRRRAETTARHE